MSDLNYQMPNSPRIPIDTLEKAAAGERELRKRAQAVVDEYYKCGNSSAFTKAVRELQLALARVPG